MSDVSGPDVSGILATTVKRPRVAPLPPSPPPMDLHLHGQRGVAWEHLLALTVLAMAVIVARRPDALFNAQFWAEDGMFWYADAYNLGGLHALLTPHTGYYQTDARLAGWAAAHVPLLYAPLLFNVIAIVVQALPVTLLMSSRYDALIPDRRLRWLLVALYLALPNSFETNANITNMQWRLALVTLLVALGAPAVSRAARLCDGVVMALGGLSGPFCAPLLVVLVIMTARVWWGRPSRPSRQQEVRWLMTLTGLDLAALLIQASAALSTARGAVAPNGASIFLGVRIVAGQVVLGLLTGQRVYVQLQTLPWWQNDWTPLIIALMTVVPLGAALLRAPLELRLFILYAALVLGLGMASPVVSVSSPQWQTMTLPGVGQRYYLFPLLALAATLVWLLSQPRAPRAPRARLGRLGRLGWRVGRVAAALALLSVALVAAPQDWEYPAYANLHWSQSVAQFYHAAPGQTVILPINPPGWSMHLVRR